MFLFPLQTEVNEPTTSEGSYCATSNESDIPSSCRQQLEVAGGNTVSTADVSSCSVVSGATSVVTPAAAAAVWTTSPRTGAAIQTVHPTPLASSPSCSNSSSSGAASGSRQMAEIRPITSNVATVLPTPSPQMGELSFPRCIPVLLADLVFLHYAICSF